MFLKHFLLPKIWHICVILPKVRTKLFINPRISAHNQSNRQPEAKPYDIVVDFSLLLLLAGFFIFHFLLKVNCNLFA